MVSIYGNGDIGNGAIPPPSTFQTSEIGGEGGMGIIIAALGGLALAGVAVALLSGAQREESLAEEQDVDYVIPSGGQVYETNEVCYDVETQSFGGSGSTSGPVWTGTDVVTIV